MLIFFMAALSAIYNDIRERTIQELNTTQRIHAQQASLAIQHHMDFIIHNLAGLARLPEIIDLDEEGKELLSSYQALNSDDISVVTRMDARGSILYTLPYKEGAIGRDISEQDHVKEVLKTHKTTVSDVFMAVQGFRTIAIHVPVFKDGVFKGTIAVLISFDRIAKKYIENIRIGKDGYAWVISEKGIEISCPVPGHVGKSVRETCKNFPEILVMADEMMKGKTGATTYHFDRIRGERVEKVLKHAVYQPIPIANTFWSIVVATPEVEVMTSLSGLRTKLLIIIIALLALTIAFTFFLLKSRIVMSEQEKRNAVARALEESERTYRTLIETTNTGFVIIDDQGRVIDANQEYVMLSGHKKLGEILGRSVVEWTAEYEKQKNAEAVKQCLDQGYIRNLEIDYTDAQGNITPIEINATVVEMGGSRRILTLCRDISERKKIDAALRESEIKYRTLTEEMSDIIWTTDLDLNITYISPSVYRDLGFTSDERMSLSLVDRLTPESLSRALEVLSYELKREGEADTDPNRTVRLELEYPTKDGSTRWKENIIRGIRDESGKVVGLHGVSRDITERKKLEDQLITLNQRLNDIIESIPDPTFVIDQSKKVIAWNRAIEDMTGVKKEDMLGKGNYEYAMPFFGERIPILIDLLDTPDFEREEFYKYVKRQGKTIYAESYIPTLYNNKGAHLWGVAVPLYDKDGNRFGSIEVIKDVTEIACKEEARLSIEKRYREILEDIEDGYFEVDLKGNFTFFNDAMCKILRYTPEEMLGMNNRTFMDKETAKKVFESFNQVFLSGKPSRAFDWELIRKDGTVCFVETSVSLMRDEKGITLGFRGLARDITEQKNLKEQLNQAQKMEAIGTLAGGIAHDFNNILMAIIGYSQLALDDLTQPEKAGKEINEVLKAGERAKDLVKQILTFSRKDDTAYSPIALRTIVKESMKMMRSMIPSTIEIRQNLLDSGLVMSNPTQVHQIVMNLCTNAVHAMEDNGGRLEVGLTRAEIDNEQAGKLEVTPGTFFKLSVSDTGKGIRQDIVDRIFDPYFTTKEKGRGTGLGLSVVHGIVKSHGGAVVCTSVEGEGTRFDVYLPVIDSVKETAEQSGDRALPRGTERILYVDDEPVLAELAEKMMESLGYRVVTQTNSLHALDYFYQNADGIDLVITDMTMPEMTGDKLAVKLMEIRKSIPIIICTGYNEHLSEKDAKGLGICEYIMKPITIEVLARTIRAVLDSRFT